MAERLKCPNCGSEDIAMNVQRKKTVILRIVRFVLLVIIFFTIIMNMAEIIQWSFYDETQQTQAVSTEINYIQQTEETKIIQANKVTPSDEPSGVAKQNPTGLVLFSIFFGLIFTEIGLQIIESKNRLCLICKDCRYVWYEEE